ncbi:hypothetical protein TL16_g09996 [Triparma laevis f. inornata]|uniref:Uncharacterized protein n=1 Tax=Triparma laevis f. inornata TaxID=1714386 RepID=A0A9W7BDC8_9STRA|nr:hypothetical protein TL16_g09996 [Triparma laevis f. inornata]
MLMAYAERQNFKLEKRKFLAKLVENANRRKKRRLERYKANVYFGAKMFGRFKYAVEVSIWYRVQLEYHLLNFTIKKKILPAWRRFTKIGKEVRARGLEFNLFYYMEKWVQYVSGEIEERAEKLAFEVWENRKCLFRAFEEWAREGKRSKRLKETSKFLNRQTKRKNIARILERWNGKTNKVVNGREAERRVKGNRERKILRGCVIVWRSSAFFKRAKRLKTLNSNWTKFKTGLTLSRRSRENKDLSSRLVYVKSLKSGLDKLFDHWKVSLYLKACVNASNAACYKIRGRRGFKMMKKNVKFMRRMRDEQALFKLMHGFKRLCYNLKVLRSERLQERMKITLKTWVNETKIKIINKKGLLRESDRMRVNKAFDIWTENVMNMKISSKVKKIRDLRSSKIIKYHFVAWFQRIRYVLDETSRLKKLKLGYSESEIRFRRKDRQIKSKFFEVWERRVIKWIEKKEMMEDAVYFNEELRKRRGIRRFEFLGMRQEIKTKIMRLKSFIDLNRKRNTFEEIWNKVEAERERRISLRLKLTFSKFKYNVFNSQKITRYITNKQSTRRLQLKHLTFLAWKSRYSSRLDKIQLIFDKVKKGWTTLAIRRLKNSPNRAGGIILIKACEKYEVKVELGVGFYAFKRNNEKGRGVDKLVGAVWKKVLRSTFERFDEHAVNMNGLSSTARISMKRWKSGVKMIVRNNDIYVAGRMKRSYLKRWFRNLGEVKRIKERRLVVHQILQGQMMNLRLRLIAGIFSNLIRYVVLRKVKRENYEVAVSQRLGFQFTKFIQRTRNMLEVREAKRKAKRFSEDKLKRVAFYSFKVGVAGGRVEEVEEGNRNGNKIGDEDEGVMKVEEL